MTNYQKGAVIERKVKKHIEDKGFHVFRMAGSHSALDLIAIPKTSQHHAAILIQVKSTRRPYKGTRGQTFQQYVFSKNMNEQLADFKTFDANPKTTIKLLAFVVISRRSTVLHLFEYKFDLFFARGCETI